MSHFFFFQAEDGIRDDLVTGVQTCALPICAKNGEPDPGGLFLIWGYWTNATQKTAPRLLQMELW